MIKPYMPQPTSLARAFDFSGAYIIGGYLKSSYNAWEPTLSIEKPFITIIGNYFFISPAQLYYREFKRNY